MFKKITTSLLIALLLVALAACGQSTSDNQQGAASNEQGQAASGGDKPVRLTIAAGNSGGTYYYIGVGIAQILTENIPDIEVSVEATAGTPAENLSLVHKNAYTLGIATLDGTYNAYHGKSEMGFPEAFDELRIVLGGHKLTFFAVALKSSGIDEVADIKGKKVALINPGATAYVQATETFKVYGLEENKDYQSTYLTYSEMSDALKDGAVDVAVFGGGVPVSSITDLSMTHDINILMFDKEKLDEVLGVNPYWEIGTVPVGTYKNQTEDLNNIFAPVVLVAHKDLPEEIAYQITKVVIENPDFLAAVHAEGKNWNKENTLLVGEISDIPYHPGTEKYLSGS